MLLDHRVRTEPAQPADQASIKARQQQTWATGDYSRVGNRLLLMAELLCEAVDLRPGARVLDVAAGSGNAALAAARRFCSVTGVDYVPELLDRARERAAAEGLTATFTEGDAEDLPFPDASFDVVLSTLGVMFAPDQERAAAELLRVCRPGGAIGLTCWTPEGFIGQLFALVARYAPPPPGLRPASRWGTEAGLRELLGDRVTFPHMVRRAWPFRYPCAAFYQQYFRTFYGPTVRAFAALDPVDQRRLAAEIERLVAQFNRSGDETMIVPADYLEVVAVRG
jgi:ubiquinone/menaquinone biosynthesis C-methylase UbiE